MANAIKELRRSTNKTQKEFASTYNIPLSTLKKWEQDESKPAPYFLSLLSSTIGKGINLIEITDMEHTFYYDELTKTIYNKKGDSIKLDHDLFPIKQKENLIMILVSLFEEYDKVRNNFIRDVEFYRNEETVWKRAI